VTPSHCTLSERKALCTRLTLLDAIGPHRTRLALANGAALAQLEGTVTNVTNYEVSAPHNETHLDTFVQAVYNDVKNVLRPYAPSQELLGVLDECITRSQHLSCITCRPERICNGSPPEEDDIAVATTGTCIAQLKELFTAANRAASTYYTTYLPPDVTVIPHITFATINSTTIPHDIPAPYFVSGATTFADHGTHRHSMVQLVLCVQHFDAGTYRAVLGVLFHELICHVFEQLQRNAPRQPYPPDDPFGEGWMDHVALWILEQIAAGEGPAAASTKPPSPRVMDVAREFHAKRHDDEDPNKSKYASLYALGIEAAEKVLRLFTLLPESRDEPLQAVIRLSVALNVHTLTHAQRQALITTLHHYTCGHGEAPLPRHTELVLPFRNYLKTNNLDELLHEIFARAPSELPVGHGGGYH
jgi:hypothetical protein